MNDPYHPLTPELQDLICGLVRAGSFPHVAAVAAGVPLKTFAFWMRCGRARRPQPHYRVFYEKVQQAQAQARVTAEAQALKRAPLSWLRYGPGRETGRLPGWTDPVKPAKLERGPHPSIARMQELVTTMLEALDAFPEARAALADHLERLQWLREETGEESLLPAAEQQAPVAEESSPPPEVHGPASEPGAELQGSAPQPAAEPQPATAPQVASAAQLCSAEQAANPPSIGNEPATKVQPVSNEMTTKPQPSGSENASNRPAAEVKEAPKRPKDGLSWWDRIMKGPWTTVAVIDTSG